MSWRRFQAFGGVVAALIVAAIVLASCKYADPAAAAGMEAFARDALAAGRITQEQFDGVLAALHAPGGPDWALIGAIVGNYVLTAFGLPAFIKHKARAAGSRLGGGSTPT